jgi:hypothetical protein
MTQIICVLTRRAVLLAADRRLTEVGTGRLYHDDTCKMVSLCNAAGVAYTGLAILDGIPTHEWICHRLVDAGVRRVNDATDALTRAATDCFSRLPSDVLYPHTFVVAGYETLEALGISPTLGIVTNMVGQAGEPRDRPGADFVAIRFYLPPEQRMHSFSAGAVLPDVRHAALVRNMGRAYSRDTSDEPLLRLITEAIRDTSRRPNFGVGEKVLTMCIPLASLADPRRQRSWLLASATQPNVATFGYFVPGASRVRQHGPSFACGEWATTSNVTEHDPGSGRQSSSMRILRLPKQSEG